MTVSDPIPLVSSLSDIYSSKEAVLAQAPRYDRLTKVFAEHFDGSKPDFIARAPGRVNLIGEHVDHMHFGCFPAALEQDIVMAVKIIPQDQSSSSSTIEFDLRNTTPRFAAASFNSGIKDTESVELIHKGDTRWANYFKVAWKGLHPHLPSSVLSSSSSLPARVQVLVDGTIPPESSLSSSAAMTVCSSITILEAFKARELINRSEMAEVAIEAERYVGVASGGMDQSASIFGERSSALHITFFPKLNVKTVTLPQTEKKCTFVVANSLVVSDKKLMGAEQYNLRVAELLMAARVFAKKNGLPMDDTTKTWRKLLDVYYKKNPLSKEDQEVEQVRSTLGEEAAQISHMSTLIEEQLPKGLISQSQVEELTGYTNEGEFHREFTSQFEIRAPQGFNLQSRVRHVLAESLRVHQFKSLCQSNDYPDVYKKLGELMNASHSSLQQDYENSCPELETIVSLAREAGALGSRLTGAGWGGSTVSLVEAEKVSSVIEALKKGYYAERWSELKEEEVDAAVAESQPAGGACVLKL